MSLLKSCLCVCARVTDQSSWGGPWAMSRMNVEFSFTFSLLPLSLLLSLSCSHVGRGGRCFSEQAHPAGRRRTGSSSGETRYGFAETGGGWEGCRREWEVCVWAWPGWAKPQILNYWEQCLYYIWYKQQCDSRRYSSSVLLYILNTSMGVKPYAIKQI